MAIINNQVTILLNSEMIVFVSLSMSRGRPGSMAGVEIWVIVNNKVSILLHASIINMVFRFKILVLIKVTNRLHFIMTVSHFSL